MLSEYGSEKLCRDRAFCVKTLCHREFGFPGFWHPHENTLAILEPPNEIH